MDEGLMNNDTGENQFVVFVFLMLGLVILVTVMGAVFYDSLWVPAVLSCTSMMIAVIVFLRLEMYNRNPWLWGVGIFLVIPVLYFIIASVIG